MGWLFGWYNRRELGDHLVSGNGLHTIKHCWKGNNLWAVQENSMGQRFIALYLCKGSPKVDSDPHNWGYKDLDESCGPSAVNCPLSYLELCPDPQVGYSTEWRERVRAYHSKRNRKLAVGQKIELGGKVYTITGRPWRNHDYSMMNEYGVNFRLPKKYMTSVEVLP